MKRCVRDSLTLTTVPPTEHSNQFNSLYICLSRLDSKYTPVISLMDMLRRAGLGKKKIVFTNKYGDHENLKQTLEDCFPR